MDTPEIDFEWFVRYQELCSHVEALAARQPDMAQVRVIGQSREGRDLLLLEITNFRTGPPEDKPAFLVHGNLHAGELSGSTCALYLAHHLLEHAGDDPLVAELLAEGMYFVGHLHLSRPGPEDHSGRSEFPG